MSMARCEKRGGFQALRNLVSKLDNLDPMPWNQAILLGVGISLMLLLAAI